MNNETNTETKNEPDVFYIKNNGDESIELEIPSEFTIAKGLFVCELESRISLLEKRAKQREVWYSKYKPLITAVWTAFVIESIVFAVLIGITPL